MIHIVAGITASYAEEGTTFLFSKIKPNKKMKRKSATMLHGPIVKQNAGIDMSKEKFDVNFQQEFLDGHRRTKSSKKFANTISGINSLITWLNKHKSKDDKIAVRVTVEATGVYHENLVYALHDLTDFDISVVLPNKFCAYKKSLNQKSKTDGLDAFALGMMGLERNLEKWKPFSPKSLSLKQLTRERVRIIEQRTACQNQLHALKAAHDTLPITIKRLKANIAFLQKQQKQVEKQIKEMIKSDSELNRQAQNICEIKGVGLMTFATLVAETNGFAQFTNRGQLVSYSGYDVVEKQSGSSVNGKTRISKKGNRFIRRALYFPSLSASQYDDKCKKLYVRVRDRSGFKMKGSVAVQRKLLLLIYTLFKKNEKYDPNYEQKQKENKQQILVG